jgi:hypothetical protein
MNILQASTTCKPLIQSILRPKYPRGGYPNEWKRGREKERRRQ